jgi:cyclic beta-1,2-glucan synthetase
LLRAFVSGAAPRYLATIGALAVTLLLLPLLVSHAAGTGLTALVFLGLVALIPASDLALALINRALMDLLGPRLLPRLELPGGVPSDLRSLVVVPTLLTSPREIEEHVDRLEIHFLANPDGDLSFALLSDWVDAPA